MFSLTYLSNFLKTREIPLINCEISLMLNWFKKWILVTDVANQVTTFTTNYTKLYVPIVTLSTQDNVKLLKQLESGFKRTIKWNKYHSKKKTHQTQNRYLDF